MSISRLRASDGASSARASKCPPVVEGLLVVVVGGGVGDEHADADGVLAIHLELGQYLHRSHAVSRAESGVFGEAHEGEGSFDGVRREDGLGGLQASAGVDGFVVGEVDQDRDLRSAPVLGDEPFLEGSVTEPVGVSCHARQSGSVRPCREVGRPQRQCS